MKKLCLILLLVSVAHIEAMLLRVQGSLAACSKRSISFGAANRYGAYDAKRRVLDDLSHDERRKVREDASEILRGNQLAPMNAKSEALRILAGDEMLIAARWSYLKRRCAGAEQCDKLDQEGQRIFAVLPAFLECNCIDGMHQFQQEVEKNVVQLQKWIVKKKTGKIGRYLKKMREEKEVAALERDCERIQE